MAKQYGWTFATIADMTPYQQLAALSDGSANAGQITFKDEESYLKWLSNRG